MAQVQKILSIEDNLQVEIIVVGDDSEAADATKTFRANNDCEI